MRHKSILYFLTAYEARKGRYFRRNGPYGISSKSFPVSVRSSATALVLAVLAFLLVGTAFVLRNEHQAVTEIAHVKAISAAEVVAANFEWVTETSHQLLQRVDDLVGPNLDEPSLDALGVLKDPSLPFQVTRAFIWSELTARPGSPLTQTSSQLT